MSGAHHDSVDLNFTRAFAIGIGLNVAFVVIEALYGLRADSMALLADAGHNLSDVLGLVLAWGASVLCQRPPTERFTYGLRRTSILAALANAMILLTVVGGIAWESILRFGAPATVAEHTVIVVALIGAVINTATALLFVAGREHDLNIRSAFVHMAADAAISIGVAISGVIVLYTGWLWLDPAVSLGIVLVILVGTWDLLRDSFSLILDAVPAGVDVRAIEGYLRDLPSVTEVHDLHVWGMSTTETALSAHLVRSQATCDDAFLARVQHELKARFGIGHATLQLETGDARHPCALAPDHLV